MRNLRFTALVVAVVLFAGAAFAQGVPQSTLTGRVLNEGQGLPGVTVTVKSPNLQGTRTAVTSVNGDFILPLLPPGDYNVTFTMSGFQTVTRQVKLSAAQSTPVQISMGISSIAAEAVVVAQRETISQTQQNATTVTSESLGKLPTARNLAAAVALAPGTSNTGPSGNTVISGAMSFENLYLVNGVAVQDNIRNTPYNLFIEDAIQEQTVTTSGISAEYGRFTGGVVNVITKSGGNVFSGSFRTNFENDKWTKKTDYVSPTTGLNTGGQGRQDRPDLRADARRADPEGPPLVLPRGPVSEERGEREHRRAAHAPLRRDDRRAALRGEADVLPRRAPHPPRELPADRQRAAEQQLRNDHGPPEPLRPEAPAEPLLRELLRDALGQLLRRGAVLDA
jgi:Outer membrane receptor for ferrienterochelin and colicins